MFNFSTKTVTANPEHYNIYSHDIVSTAINYDGPAMRDYAAALDGHLIHIRQEELFKYPTWNFHFMEEKDSDVMLDISFEKNGDTVNVYARVKLGSMLNRGDIAGRVYAACLMWLFDEEELLALSDTHSAGYHAGGYDCSLETYIDWVDERTKADTMLSRLEEQATYHSIDAYLSGDKPFTKHGAAYVSQHFKDIVGKDQVVYAYEHDVRDGIAVRMDVLIMDKEVVEEINIWGKGSCDPTGHGVRYSTKWFTDEARANAEHVWINAPHIPEVVALSE